MAVDPNELASAAHPKAPSDIARIDEAWLNIEKKLRTRLGADGVTDFAVGWIAADLRQRYISIMLQTPLVTAPFASEESRRQVKDMFERNTVAILGEMILLELELFAARFGKDALWTAAARQAMHANHFAATSAGKPN